MWRVGNNFKYWNREGLIEDEMTVKFCKSWPRKETYEKDRERIVFIRLRV